MLWPQAYADEIVRIFRHTLETGEPHVVPERIEQRLDRGVIEYYEWQVNRIPLPGGRHGVVCYFRDISQVGAGARGAARGRPPQGRVPRHAGARAAQSARAAAQLAATCCKLARRRRRAPRAGARDHGAPAQPPGAPGRRPAGGVAHHAAAARAAHASACELDAALRNAVETSEPLIRAGRHRLIVSLPDEPLVARRATRCASRRSSRNLLNNAAKYTDDGGTIAVDGAARRRRGAWSTVSDNGTASRPRSCRSSSRCSRAATAAHGATRAAWASAWRWCAGWPRCTAAASRRRSEGRGKGSRVHRAPAAGRGAVAAAPSARRRERAGMRRCSDPGGRRQPRRRREPGACCSSTLGADVRVAHDGPEALAAFDDCRPRRGAARHRHARHGRLRGGARACARSRGAARRRSSRSPAGARTRTAGACARPASTTTWSSRPNRRPAVADRVDPKRDGTTRARVRIAAPPERCPSGRRGRPAKALYRLKPVSRVRIPLSPPVSPSPT